MREILFRGKDLETGEWLYNMTIAKHHYSDDKVFSYYIGRGNQTIDGKTLGQFTGLTDKNGKKIFEGDIIHTHYANAPKSDFVEQVVFCDGRFCALFSTTDGSGKMWSALPLSAPHIKTDKSIYMEWCEVIGNIHDNPELLEVSE